MGNFSNLHLHTSNGSYLDSMVKIPELIKKVNEFGHKYCACTDHGSLSALLNFHSECKNGGVIPILGCEFYEAQGHRTDKSGSIFHLLLLAKNKIGYKNLIKMSTEANITGKYRNFGRVDDELLRKYNDGIICLSACLSGRLSKNILESNGDIKTANAVINYYREIFGDDYYLEIMDNGIQEQEFVDDIIIQIGKSRGINIVMTNDVHYLNADDADAHDILKRIHYNKKEFAGFSGGGYHLRDANEYNSKYSEFLDTRCVTDKIEVYDVIEQNKMWHMPIVDNSENVLIGTARNKLDQYFSKNVLEYKRDEYKDRLEYELGVINKLGYADYFLIVADFVQWARCNNVLIGPGRGSAGGSLVSYMLGIINFDPMNEECPLYFERFLNPDRISMPDIDIDFNDRDKVIAYLKDKYGDNRVVNIGTISTLGTRDVIRNVARVMGYSDNVIKPILDEIPTDTANVTNESLYDSIESYKALIDGNSLFKQIWQYAIKIEGAFKNPSIHASGVIISPKDFDDIPLNMVKDVVFTQYDMHNVESLGYVKFDILGLKTLDVINKAVGKTKSNININELDYMNPDKKTMNLINEGKTNCVFQWESDGYKKLIKRLKPDKFVELIDLNTLYRPGCMESGLTDQYINRKFGKEEITYIHESLSGILKRYGLPLFQEEVMLMCNKVAGFSLSEADVIRKAIGKKNQQLLNEQKPAFVDGCKKHGGMSDEKANELWDMLEKFGRYSWNLSHGLAYTIISYWTAYLSANHPAEFFSANIDMAGDFKALVKIINEAKSRGIKIVPPDINKSDLDTVVVSNSIYLSFTAIKGISDKIALNIIEERDKNGQFYGYDDFCLRVEKSKCNKSAKDALIKAGAFDFSINDKMKRFDLLIYNDQRYKDVEQTVFYIIKEEYNKIGIYIDENPISLLKLKVYDKNFITGEIVSLHKHIDKNGKKMCFLELTDFDKQYDVTVFNDTYSDNVDILKVGNIIGVSVNVNKYGMSAIDLFSFVVGSRVTIDKDRFLPVTLSTDEILGKVSGKFNRFVLHRFNDNKLVFYKVNENNKYYSTSNIVGYKMIGG